MERKKPFQVVRDHGTHGISTHTGALTPSLCGGRRAGMSQDILLGSMYDLPSVFSAEAFNGAVSRLCSVMRQREGLLSSACASVASCISASLSSSASFRPFPAHLR